MGGVIGGRSLDNAMLTLSIACTGRNQMRTNQHCYHIVRPSL